MSKIKEDMWCRHCEHEWVTEDYENCHECPNCKTEPVRIYRQSSYSFMYAYEAKQKEKKNHEQHN